MYCSFIVNSFNWRFTTGNEWSIWLYVVWSQHETTWKNRHYKQRLYVVWCMIQMLPAPLFVIIMYIYYSLCYIIMWR